MINADTYIETAADTISFPSDMPEWVTPELITEAAATQPNIPEATQGPNGMLAAVETPYGTVYIAPGAPQWVNDNAIAQAKAAFEAIGTPPAPPPPPPPPAPSPTGVIATVVGAAQGVVNRAIDLIKPAASAVAGVAGGVVDATLSVINKLVPTIQELAIGLTSRFADLASNIAAKTIDFGTYSFQLAVDAANAMGGVLEEAWSWILNALVRFFSVLLAPLESLAKSLTSNLLDPAL